MMLDYLDESGLYSVYNNLGKEAKEEEDENG